MSDFSAEAVVQARGVCKEYATCGEPLVVLDGVDLEVGRGGSVAIMGPSGSGKSTLLHILGTLDQPTAGSVRLSGEDPAALSANALADFRNRELGFVFQDHQLLPQCTALENVLVPTLASKGDRGKAEERARRLLERVGLGERLDYPPSDLSGGERQRVAIARATINQPRILLCDEPTGNLDPAISGAIADCFRQLQEEEGVSLVIVTHNADFAARFDRTLLLNQGRLEG